ncbi:MAG: hypothetical protein Q9M26_07495, partial [Mariprofundales bacterium]|nr:hypothetical protein [Mariprofundales bacterium]
MKIISDMRGVAQRIGWIMLLLLMVIPFPINLSAAGFVREDRGSVLRRLDSVIHELTVANKVKTKKPAPKVVVVHSDKEVQALARVRAVVNAIPRPMRVVIDVRSNHSDGKHSFADLLKMARARHIEAIAFTDHDHTGVRYGLDPAIGLSYTYELRSLYTTGAEKFIADVKQAQASNPDMVVMAGTEDTPGYHWTGLPFSGDFTLVGSDKHMIALGMENAAQIKGLPSYSLKHMHSNLKFSMAFWVIVVFALLLYLMLKRKRGLALLVFAAFIAFMATWMMQIRHEKDPYVDFIDTAHNEGLFTVWAHPGTHTGFRVEKLGVKVATEPYNDAVFNGPHADAFAAVYGDTDGNCKPGGPWDRYLQQYLNHTKDNPLWGVAAGDFHYQGGFGTYLGDYPMDVWVKSRTEQGIMAALRLGHNVSWQEPKDRNVRIRALALVDDRGKSILPGQSLQGSHKLYLAIAADEPFGQGKPMQFTAQVVVDGLVVDRPLVAVDAGKMTVIPLKIGVGDHVVRVRIPVQQGFRLEANPFFVRMT